MNEKNKIGAVDSSTSFTDIADIVYLTPEDSKFSMTDGGFLTLISEKDVKPEKLFDEGAGPEGPPKGFGGGLGGPGGFGGPPPRFGGGGPMHGGGHRGHGRKAPCEVKYTDDGKRDYGRVILHRAFPFDRPNEIISVQQEDGFEIGIIKNINDFDDETIKILNRSLDDKYYIPEIKKILSAKDRFGFVYFKCETDGGLCDFVVRNPFGSIIRLSETRIIIIDIDGNRYSVKNTNALDRKSYRKIELFI